MKFSFCYPVFLFSLNSPVVCLSSFRLVLFLFLVQRYGVFFIQTSFFAFLCADTPFILTIIKNI